MVMLMDCHGNNITDRYIMHTVLRNKFSTLEARVLPLTLLSLWERMHKWRVGTDNRVSFQ